ncbi:PilZ domain-containing protein [Roseateles depolymerans]|uniref:Putative flagellar brake protein containing PilZ domain n=1 Tax=Roseateles depolymerans TaxID=76731 RepID=A0A0U3MP31_9BURK|nr:PilZ domain-containing protein [Roseateles depolymerans]ALV06106.1 Putative flagellar brake protein containing PilZ domain [Roseateles depolymerans]REG11918.1 PilZ domain-containing protein [Roseateles depolymerans]
MNSRPFPLDPLDDDTNRPRPDTSGHQDSMSGGAVDLDEPVDRRSSPRQAMPLGPAFHADLAVLGRSLSLSLEDVSLGGVALRASKAEAGALLVGKRLPQVRLSLGDFGVVTVALEVRARRSFRSFLAGEQVYVGCRFVDLEPAVQERLRIIIDQLQG